MEVITKETLSFLKELKLNNNREWFAEHKAHFKKVQLDVKEFYDHIKLGLERHDKIEKVKMFRIYRDIRFSNDKTPFQPHFAGSFIRSGADLRGGYYLRIKPVETFIAIGFWAPNKEDLLRIRKEWETDASEFRDLMNDNRFQAIWGELQGDEVKTAPKGFDKNHQNIDLIRKKGYIFQRYFSDNEVLSSHFLEEIDSSFKIARPYLDLMSSILTTDLNGESLV